MNLQEYEKVKNYNYLEYCDYLQKKYGIGLCDYMRPSWTKNLKISRTKEGLNAHHKYEDHAILLSKPEHAKKYPYEWQMKENIVYCNLLEHLFLHILICEGQPNNKSACEILGLGGVITYIVPELNDVYSGWVSKQAWQINCHNVIINHKDVYLLLLKRFKKYYEKNSFIIRELYKSDNVNLGWPEENNYELYNEIEQL